MAAQHQNDHQNDGNNSDLSVGMTGFGLGLVMIFVVGAFSYWMAL